MTWRIVHIKESEKIKLKLDNLEIFKRGKTFLIPLSDISMVILEGKTTITTSVLSQFTKFNIALIVCDNKYLPTGILLNYGNYHHCAKRVQEQIKWTEENKKEIWKQIIQQKLQNQIAFAQLKNSPKERIDIMNSLLNELQPGDVTNREGLVAKVYFNSLYGMKFTREDDCLVNGAMDYGYAIVRAAMARIVVGQGLMSMIGIFYRNEFNSFNLVDDLMEPFRPIMDYWIDKYIISEYEFLTYEARLKMIDFLNQPMRYGSKKSTVDQVMQKYVSNFLKAITSGGELTHPIMLKDFMEEEK